VAVENQNYYEVVHPLLHCGFIYINDINDGR